MFWGGTVALSVKLKGEACMIENGIFLSIWCKCLNLQTFPFERLLKFSRAGVLLLGRVYVPWAYQGVCWILELSCSYLAEKAICQRMSYDILLNPITSQFRWLVWWLWQNVLRLWRLAFHFLNLEMLGKSNGLRSEMLQRASSPPLELVALPGSPVSFWAQKLCILLLRTCTCHHLQNTALGFLELKINWYRSMKEFLPCLKLD